MGNLDNILQQHSDSKIMLYGLGTETERFLDSWGDRLNICGLLDGFREDGEMFGYPILPIGRAVEMGISLIVVIARPGSCKAITKRIGEMCRANGISLFDVRGRDLLLANTVSFDLSALEGYSRAELLEEIDAADVVSFDLFDTLVARKVYSYTDVFELVELRLQEKGIVISGLARHRLMAEKELSKNTAPTLAEIYAKVLEETDFDIISASELAELEYEIDLSVMTARNEMRDVLTGAVTNGKRVVITTDSYYSESQIKQILERFEIKGYEKVFVSCEYRTAKTQNLFKEVMAYAGDNDKILHIGDDVAADVEPAGKYGIKSFRIYSGMDLFDALGGMGTEPYLDTISDKLKAGLFIARVFNSPFWFDAEDRKIAIYSAFDVGYVFCAPMITDFVLWMKERAEADGYSQILFCARDGFLIKRLYEKVDDRTKSVYFLTSRTAAIRAGMETEQDIEYVNSMKFFGPSKEALKVRFGIGDGEENSDFSQDDSDYESKLNRMILEKAELQRENYKKYIDTLSVSDEKAAVFDFVAKGTTQLFLGKLFKQHLKGYYFLQLEPQFMADKGLDIEPFYTEAEKESSAIYDNYYILETMLTAPYPQLLQFDSDGKPVYADETRSEADIHCFEKMQAGIEAFYDDYIRILPEKARYSNKQLDEVFLSLVNHIRIEDEDFGRLKVEDPFFGRMTDIKDVI